MTIEPIWSILFYSGLTIFLSFFLGFGLALYFIPKKLREHSFWLMPWFGLVFLIFFLTLFSLLGFTVKQISPGIIIFLTAFNLWAIKKKSWPAINWKRDLLVFLIIGASIMFNCAPLIKKDKFFTSLSLGNCDVIAYVTGSDYLVNHSILEGFVNQEGKAEVKNIIYGGYRWGTPMLPAFFLNLFKLQAWQYIYLFQVIIFSLTLPLILVLTSVLFKTDLWGSTFGVIITGFNVNLLYMLYHVFAGQILFWPLQLLLLIFLSSYFYSSGENSQAINLYDVIIGGLFASLFFSYHEATFFMVAPLLLAGLWRLVFKRSPNIYLQKINKIALVAFFTSALSILNAFWVNFFQIIPNDDPIGWQLFRAKLPYANPVEMMGFYSLHSFPPLSPIIAVGLSLVVLIIWLVGILKIKAKILISSFLIVYVAFALRTTLLRHNFFSYNRVVTFSLPLFLILFTVGLLSFLDNRKRAKKIILTGLVLLEIFSAARLNQRFIKEGLSINQGYTSLAQIKLDKINEPVYKDVFNPYLDSGNCWDQIWTDYFFYQRKPSLMLNKPREEAIIFAKRNDVLALISSSAPRPSSLQLLFKEVIWENDFYRLARLCHSDECLLGSAIDLSKIIFGQSQFEDSLLISGWGVKEAEARWAQDKSVVLRLVNKNAGYFQLRFTGRSLAEPQEIKIHFNGILTDKQSMQTDWKDYQTASAIWLLPGVQEIRLEFSEVYRPADIFGTQDQRWLAAAFKEIGLEEGF